MLDSKTALFNDKIVRVSKYYDDASIKAVHYYMGIHKINKGLIIGENCECISINGPNINIYQMLTRNAYNLGVKILKKKPAPDYDSYNDMRGAPAMLVKL